MRRELLSGPQMPQRAAKIRVLGLNWAKLGLTYAHLGQNPGDAPGAVTGWLWRGFGWGVEGGREKIAELCCSEEMPLPGCSHSLGLALLEQRSDSSDPSSALGWFVHTQSIKRNRKWGLLPVELTPYPSISLAGSSAEQVRGFSFFSPPCVLVESMGRGSPGLRGVPGLSVGQDWGPVASSPA